MSLKFSVVTVCYNAVDTLEETILSVCNQSYSNIEYVIIDGGSTDGTVEIIKQYADKLAYWISEPDKGMYDALKKGFQQVHGDVCCYINADDFYNIHAFEVVNDFFENHPEILWIKGRDIVYNERSQITSDRMPNIVYNNLLNKGIYTTHHRMFIQQESIFWRKELNTTVDWNVFSSLELAGDYYLWCCFSKKAVLHIVDSYLGGFRRRQHQLSSNVSKYESEVMMITKKAGVIDVISARVIKIIHSIFNGGVLYRKIFRNRIHAWNEKKAMFE